MNFKKILAIGAHPDDIEYGCYGFLHQHKNKSNIHIHVLSVGSLGDPSKAERRINETKKAFAPLNPNSFKIRNKKSITDNDYNELLLEIEASIEEYQPDLILTHGPNDTHQEHLMAYKLVISAARRRKLSILKYSIVSNTQAFNPTFFISLTKEEIELKVNQLALHKSQNKNYYMNPEYIKIFHQRPYHVIHQMEYCEAFEIERIMI